MESFQSILSLARTKAKYASKFILTVLRIAHKGEGKSLGLLYMETMLRGMCTDASLRHYVEDYFPEYFEGGGAQKLKDETKDEFAKRLAAERNFVNRIMTETK